VTSTDGQLFSEKKTISLSVVTLVASICVTNFTNAHTHTSQDTVSNSEQKLNRKEVAELIAEPLFDGDFSDCGQADRSV
jgi:outer membrane protein assembly factor BamE (lipoprotein component of BamABCDE complex)